MILCTTPSDNRELGPNADRRTLVDVCIATRRRPALLRRLLDSLAAQQLPENLRFRVIVVDNDDERSAEPVVAASLESGLDILYANEPERNIASARNRSFALTSSEAGYIATIDDDAAAPPQWLDTMVRTARDYRADVVLGAVRRVLPPDAAKYLLESGVFDMYNPPTGSTEWLVYNTANALLRRETAMGRPGPFRVDYGLTGGEDTELFHSLATADAKIVWCREAQVDEVVLPERVRLSWILPRSFREGVTYYKVYQRWTLSAETPFPWRWLSFAAWAARRTAEAALLALAGIVSPRRRALAAAALKDLAFNCGIAARTLGIGYEPRHR